MAEGGSDSRAESSDLGRSSKKPRLSLSLKRPSRPDARFASPTKPELVEQAAEGVVPTNTKHSTKWAVKTFMSWLKQRNERVPDDQIESSILSCRDHSRLCYVLRLFVLEVRKSNGECYPPASLLSGINREMMNNKIDFMILDKSDIRFRDLHLTLDSVSSELHHSGLGTKKNAEVISIEVEDEEGSTWNINPKSIAAHCVLLCWPFFRVKRSARAL